MHTAVTRTVSGGRPGGTGLQRWVVKAAAAIAAALEMSRRDAEASAEMLTPEELDEVLVRKQSPVVIAAVLYRSKCRLEGRRAAIEQSLRHAAVLGRLPLTSGADGRTLPEEEPVRVYRLPPELRSLER